MTPHESLPVATGIHLAVRRWWPTDERHLPVLCVHGLASNSMLWAGVGAALSDHGHQAAAVDLRGHGHSDKPDDGYDVATVADEVIAVLDALGWDRAVLAGQSWGGNVVVEATARHPGRVAATVAVDGGFIELSSRFASWEECASTLRPPELIGTPAARLEAGMRASHPDWSDAAIEAAMHNFELRADGTIAPWLTLDRHMTVLRGLWEHSPAHAFDRIDAPVLLVPAESGPAAWVADKRAAVEGAMERLRRGAVHWLHGDHDLHAQHPATVAQVISEWSRT